jgi:hypothetical protein
VVSIGGVLMSGIWWITKRREEVKHAEKESHSAGKGAA